MQFIRRYFRKAILIYRNKGFLYLVKKSFRITYAIIFVRLLGYGPGQHKKSTELLLSIRDANARKVIADEDLRQHTTSVIVCVHNAYDDVKKCLASVTKHSELMTELIIVDDGSEPQTRDFLKDFSAAHTDCILIRHEQAQRYTKAANAGLRRSSGDLVVLLNSDTIVSRHWLHNMLRCAFFDDRTGLVGPLGSTASWQSVPEIEDNGDWAHNEVPEGMSLEQWAGVIHSYSCRTYPTIPFLNGFCLGIKRAVLEQIGYFDEESFPRGYGEENDYCLRAQERGWRLRVADDTYVFHAESRSYSHATRHDLSSQASDALVRKYGLQTIEDGVQKCKNSLALQSVRARVRMLPDLARQVDVYKKKYAGKKILFLLPVGVAGGGANVVLSEVRALQEMGIDVTICNLSQNKKTFLTSYQGEFLPDMEFIVTPHDIDKVLTKKKYDAVVATANESVWWLYELEKRGLLQFITGYYVQDYEPFFYDDEEIRDHVKKTYTCLADMKVFTKTQWNRDVLLEETGRRAAVIGASYNTRLFAPIDESLLSLQHCGLIVCGMVRASSEYRAPKRTMYLLRTMKKKYGKKVTIVIFGSKNEDLVAAGYPLDFSFISLELVNAKTLRHIFSYTDIFVDCSDYQAMGLTAMEAMACGSCVVVPKKGGSNSYATHDVNALLVDTESMDALEAALDGLITRNKKRERLRQKGLEDILVFNEYGSSAKMLDTLFG